MVTFALVNGGYFQFFLLLLWKSECYSVIKMKFDGTGLYFVRQIALKLRINETNLNESDRNYFLIFWYFESPMTQFLKEK